MARAAPSSISTGPMQLGWRHGGERCIGATGALPRCAKRKGIRLAANALTYFSHWLTPVGRPKRYDTRFFIAAAPVAQTALFDGTEMVEQLWIAPAEAIARSGSLKLLTPTRTTLGILARFDDTESLLEWALHENSVSLTMPRVGSGSEGHASGPARRAGLRRIGPH